MTGAAETTRERILGMSILRRHILIKAKERSDLVESNLLEEGVHEGILQLHVVLTAHAALGSSLASLVQQELGDSLSDKGREQGHTVLWERPSLMASIIFS